MRGHGDGASVRLPMKDTAFQNPPDAVIYDILSRPQRIAVVGCSPDPGRDSHRVARLLMQKGHTVIPVTPGADAILGQTCYASLYDVPPPIDMVDIFRRAEMVGPIVDAAIAVGARVVWLQLGVIDDEAAARAQRAGLTVVMDRCPAIEYDRLF